MGYFSGRQLRVFYFGRCEQPKNKNMRLNLFLGILAILTGLISCEKKYVATYNEVISHDTIKPLSYFPVYPGSFWKYRVIKKRYDISINGKDTSYSSVNIDTSYSEMRTASEYKIHYYNVSPQYNPNGPILLIEFSDSVYVPFLNDEPIYGYDKVDVDSYYLYDDVTYKKYPFLSENIGFEFLYGWYDFRHTYIGSYYKIIDKTTDLNNDSMIVVHGHRKIGPDKYLRRDEWKYYYKDIGLKYNYVFDQRIGDTIYKKELIDYYINK